MKKPVKNTKPVTLQDTALRRRPEKMAHKKAALSPKKPGAMSPEEMRRTLHELQVHQIELEMQNEEMRRTQVELDAARVRYFDLYDLAPVGYCTISKQGLIMEANLTASTLLGVPRCKLVTQLLARFILKKDQDIYYLHRKKLLDTGEPQTCELQIVKKDGTIFWAHLTEAAAKDESGATIFRVVMSDITERKVAEEALEKYREHLEDLVRKRTIKLEASNKELEAFSYSASHDLRAPLRTIDGFSQALLEDCEDKLDIQGKDYLIRIRAATRRMADLIEDLLKLSRITRTEMNIEKINLTRIARSIIDELQKSQPLRHVEIKIAVGLEDAADSRLMRITLDNLLGNAWKFTEKQAKAVIELGCTEEGGKKVYFIRDNGVGFDMAYVDKLFAPFQRLHNEEEFPGTGIGLALVRRIIHRHGGKVWTEGQTGKGATFYFSLNEK
jgi:PAS domain S-box-containing protein